ncbi:MAG: MFS transporter, partial [Actinomycetota bacterium]|nr:MFS transporter [Actinomycetota bacterium]
RVFAALASTASSMVLLQVVWIHPIMWSAFRLVFGLCAAGLYVVAESWLNDLATNATRGRILAVYMVVTMSSLAGGQFLINAADPGGFVLFALASVLVSMALVPMALSASSAPPARVPTPIKLRDLVRQVPTGIISSFLVGVATGILIGLGAVYAAASGMTNAELSTFLAAPMVGAVLLQVPIGRLSDHFPRRGVMVLVALGATLVASTLPFVDATSPIGYLLMALLGGAMFPLYSLAIAYTNDWLEYEEMLGASAMLVRVNGTGAIVGPLIGAALLAIDLDLFFVALAAARGIITLFVLQRIVARNPIPMEEQGPFQPFPGRASRMAVRLLTRRGPS